MVESELTQACLTVVHVVLQGCSTDITDLDTSKGDTSHLEYLKQVVHISSQDMLSSAKTIISNNPQIEKVVILERIPRFDLNTVDPINLKSKLSEYGNIVLKKELAKSDFKHKILIGAHNLPSVLQGCNYGNPDRYGYDGIHLYGQNGKNLYTGSLCDILQQVIHSSRSLHNHSSRKGASHTQNKAHNSGNQYSHQNTQQMSSDLSSNFTPSLPPASVFPPPSEAPVTKQDFTIIDIEEEFSQSYAIPTQNRFTSLGNC